MHLPSSNTKTLQLSLRSPFKNEIAPAFFFLGIFADRFLIDSLASFATHVRGSQMVCGAGNGAGSGGVNYSGRGRGGARDMGAK